MFKNNMTACLPACLLSFELLRCCYGKLFCFKKSVIHLIYTFTTYELYIFFIIDLSYIVCLFFLYSFNYKVEDSLFSLNEKLARKLLNQIFTKSKQSLISSFDCNMCLDYVMFLLSLQN